MTARRQPKGVFDVLDGADPDALALVTRSDRLTYAALDQAADRAASALHALGIRPGDRVAASLPNDTDIVVAFHGAMRLGAIWVGINQALAPPEKEYMLKDAGASLYLSAENRREWHDALSSSTRRPDGPPPDPRAPAAIAYTSGTTGFPKGAVHCQAALIRPGAATVARRGWGPDLRKGDALALTILNMHVLTTLLTAQAGGTAVIFDRADVASIVEWIKAEQVTVWNGVPAQLYTMVHDPSVVPADLASLSEVWVGGADCPDRLRDAFEDRFHINVSRTYGLTEAPALVCLDDLEAARPSGTSGRALDHISLTIAADGEIMLAPVADGPWAGLYRPALGYWPAADAGPVLATGVAACAVVGVPDERLGERVGAAIEPRPGWVIDQPALIEHCRAYLAAYKVPERIVVVDQLPRNQMGKVPRPDVVRLLAAG
jgi:acyl-CoA synthetase (AMP-forming)/AMP-acid ligase II